MKNEYKVFGDITAIYVKKRSGKTYIVLIDTEDLEIVKSKCGSIVVNDSGDNIYANYHCKERRRGRPLHRLIMNTPDDLLVDHIFHNSLDNRKKFLRNCTKAQNNQNLKPRRNNKYRNVYYSESMRKYAVRIQIDGVLHDLGYFEDQEEANKAAIAFRRKHMPFSTI